MTYNPSVNEPSSLPLLVIVNANAGAGRAGARWPALARELARVGLAFEPALTQAPGDAMRLAEAAARAGRRVVAVGGDGTVNEVVNGLMAGHAPGSLPPTLGVIPSGTAQDFARSAGIPLAPRAAIALLARAEPHPLDVGRIRFPSGSVRYFANYAGTGFDATVTARAKDWGHVLRGALAYVVGFFAVLRGYENHRFELRPDGGPPLEAARRINMVIIANGGNYAGVLRIAPDARLDDGLLDVVVVGDVGRFELMAYLPLALFGRHLGHPKVTTLRVRSVGVSAGEPLPVQSDGEMAGDLPAEFDVMPGALRLLRA
jgi:diacylglycerol kinase (ATP)